VPVALVGDLANPSAARRSRPRWSSTREIATSAREALQIVTRVSPDVILTDIAMPGEDGYWLLSEIRRHADGGVRGLPVVAATAYGRDHSRARVLAAGFLDHLPKPVEPEVLWRAIAAAVGR
jgi:CheY-like chemotaxis protein